MITLAKAELQDHSKNPPMVFLISPILMGSMIDRLLGGTGTDTEVDGSYVYTDVEIALYECDQTFDRNHKRCGLLISTWMWNLDGKKIRVCSRGSVWMRQS